MTSQHNTHSVCDAWPWLQHTILMKECIRRQASRLLMDGKLTMIGLLLQEIHRVLPKLGKPTRQLCSHKYMPSCNVAGELAFDITSQVTNYALHLVDTSKGIHTIYNHITQSCCRELLELCAASEQWASHVKLSRMRCMPKEEVFGSIWVSAAHTGI